MLAGIKEIKSEYWENGDGMAKTIIIGSDHAGFEMKEFLIRHLKQEGFCIKDTGTFSEASVDFSPIAQAVAEEVGKDPQKQGILICGTGIGMSVMANKVAGIRAALVHDLFSAKATREHNDSNILCMGARVISDYMALEIAHIWLGTAFLGGRHEARIRYIAEYEQKQRK